MGVKPGLFLIIYLTVVLGLAPQKVQVVQHLPARLVLEDAVLVAEEVREQLGGVLFRGVRVVGFGCLESNFWNTFKSSHSA